MTDSRGRLVELAVTKNLKVLSTMLRKQMGNLDTYRKNKDIIGITSEPINASTHEQIYCVPAPSRWKNLIKNMESDTQANIDSYLHPHIMTI